MPEEATVCNTRNLFQGCNVTGYHEAAEVLWVQGNNIYVCVAQQISSKSKTDDSAKVDTLAFPMPVLAVSLKCYILQKRHTFIPNCCFSCYLWNV
jgi:hypothetical protein